MTNLKNKIKNLWKLYQLFNLKKINIIKISSFYKKILLTFNHKLNLNRNNINFNFKICAQNPNN